MKTACGFSGLIRDVWVGDALCITHRLTSTPILVGVWLRRAIDVSLNDQPLVECSEGWLREAGTLGEVG